MSSLGGEHLDERDTIGEGKEETVKAGKALGEQGRERGNGDFLPVAAYVPSDAAEGFANIAFFRLREILAKIA